ncbi:MAG TPA: DsrE family protein [Methylomirabilota bacterium]|nr:DsrE family protein [Methylomirabilota bacterium]
MGQYVLIESKSPLDGGQYSFELGGQLREAGHDVSVYLVQDGVFAARRSFEAGDKLLSSAKSRRIGLLADEVSLRQRGISRDRLAEAVRVSNMEELVDLLMEKSDKAIWH